MRHFPIVLVPLFMLIGCKNTDHSSDHHTVLALDDNSIAARENDVVGMELKGNVKSVISNSIGNKDTGLTIFRFDKQGFLTQQQVSGSELGFFSLSRKSKTLSGVIMNIYNDTANTNLVGTNKTYWTRDRKYAVEVSVGGIRLNQSYLFDSGMKLSRSEIWAKTKGKLTFHTKSNHIHGTKSYVRVEHDLLTKLIDTITTTYIEVDKMGNPTKLLEKHSAQPSKNQEILSQYSYY